MKQEIMTVVSQTAIAPRIYQMVLSGQLVSQMNVAGQFIHLLVPRADLLLRRPISLAKIDQERGQCTIIYRVEGDGTAALSQLDVGDSIDVMGPLGNGFDTSMVQPNDEVLIVGGGIGTPPLYELARRLKGQQAVVTVLLGFQTKEAVFYEEAFRQLVDHVVISTDDGSYGHHGHAGHLIDHYQAEHKTPKAVYACGAPGMLKNVDQRFSDHPYAFISMEARMACGMGACYACVCQLVKDPQKSLKVCDEGPVVSTGEVMI